MAYGITAAANKYPVFGIDSAATMAWTIGGVAQAALWVVTDIQISTAGPSVELQDANGLTVARTYYNYDAGGKSLDRTLTMTLISIGATEAAAKATNKQTAAPGAAVVISTCASFPDAVDSWELVSMDQAGSNTGYPTVTLVAKHAV